MPRGRFKPFPLIVGRLASKVRTVVTRAADQQSDLDRQAIVQTLKAYTRAWFGGDAAAMEQCLHPDLTTRVLQLEAVAAGAGDVRSLARSQGIQATLGACTHPLERRSEIHILDITGRVASARAVLGDWAAHVHLSFTGERWAIVNILWEWCSPRDRRTA